MYSLSLVHGQHELKLEICIRFACHYFIEKTAVVLENSVNQYIPDEPAFLHKIFTKIKSIQLHCIIDLYIILFTYY